MGVEVRRQIVAFTLLLLYHCKTTHSTPRRLGEPQNQYGRNGEENNLLSLPGVKPFLIQESLRMVYFSYSHSIMTFGLVFWDNSYHRKNKKNELHGPSPRANYTDRATAACRRSDCQLLRIKGATWSA
jgi:hypothetical protein